MGVLLGLLVFPFPAALILQDFIDDKARLGKRERVGVVVSAEFEG